MCLWSPSIVHDLAPALHFKAFEPGGAIVAAPTDPGGTSGSDRVPSYFTAVLDDRRWTTEGTCNAGTRPNYSLRLPHKRQHPQIPPRTEGTTRFDLHYPRRGIGGSPLNSKYTSSCIEHTRGNRLGKPRIAMPVLSFAFFSLSFRRHAVGSPHAGVASHRLGASYP